LEGLRGQDVQLASVETQLPAREVTHVAVEQAEGVADGVRDVSQPVADHERGALEDADLSVRHGARPWRTDLSEGTTKAGWPRAQPAPPIGVIPRFPDLILGNDGYDGTERRAAGLQR